MQILFVSNLYPPVVVGGYELNCADVATGLRRRGHAVAVLTTNHRAETVPGPEPGIGRRLRFGPGWAQPGVPLTPRTLWTDFRVQWHNVHVFRRAVARLRPDVVVIWNGNHLGEQLLRAAEQAAPTVYYLEDAWLAGELGAVPRARRERLRRRLYHWAFRAAGLGPHASQAERLIFNSRALQQQYSAAGADVRRGTVIHLGVDPELFAFQPQHITRRAPDEPPRVLYTGQIAAHKGITTLVDALARLRALPGLAATQLTLVGGVRPVEYGDELRARIAALGLAGTVALVPARPRAELPALLGAHDVFAFPSEWEEPFALAPLEAMAAGLPVVASLRGGSAEVIRDGQNALAFAAGNAADLAKKLAWVLTHPCAAAALGQAASAEIRATYTVARQVAAVEAYLAAVVPTASQTVACITQPN
jgi:glycogen(starch) synthase